jgi:hypothetical protein
MENESQNKSINRDRPKVSITLPQYNAQFSQPSPYLSPYVVTNLSGSGTPVQLDWTQVLSHQFQPHKARELFFKQLDDFKGLAKTGLSFGEKTAFWIYNRFSVWSKKWFTHLFLIIVMALYSLIGGIIFMNIEGNNSLVIFQNENF